MIRVQDLHNYTITAKYGQLFVHQERFVAVESLLNSEVDRIVAIAKKKLNDRNVPLSHEDIHVFAVFEDTQIEYIFNRIVKVL